MGSLRALLLAVILLSALGAQAGDRYAELSDLFSLYNHRFDAQGKYRRNDRLAEEFTRAQESFVGRMKALGALQEVLFVENDFDLKLWVRLYVLKDEAGRLMTFYWEQGTYQDQEVRSFMRFRTLSNLEQGLEFIPVLSTHAFVVKGVALNSETGGTLQLVYAESIREHKMVTRSLLLLKRGTLWSLNTEDQKPVTKAWVDVWVHIIPPNGGVRSLSLK